MVFIWQSYFDLEQSLQHYLYMQEVNYIHVIKLNNTVAVNTTLIPPLVNRFVF